MRDPCTSDSRTALPVTGVSTGSAITHSTRPSHPTTAPGTTTGTTWLSTGCTVDPSASAPVRAPGPDHSLALAGSGTDSLRRRSDEAGTAAFQPQLVLTFGAE
ncbi:hypothetical protein ACFRQM_37960 [Streptomyces sp. NPDC056831]|uniref:hypothetical protein n=1 Tax=Streptomyces sp. NPDC056831 TaxID=3345954 RepID=UPI00367CE1D6